MLQKQSTLRWVIGLVLPLFVLPGLAEGAGRRKPVERQPTRRASADPRPVAPSPRALDREQGVPEPEAHNVALELLAKEDADPGVLVVWVRQQAGARVSDVECERIVDCVLKTSDPLMLLALFRLESRFNPRARSREGALGLGQVMPGHVAGLRARGIVDSEKDLLEIEGSVRAADYVWGVHRREARGDRSRALARYGGFRTRAPRPYLQKVYGSVTELAARVIRDHEERLRLADASMDVAAEVEQPLTAATGP